MSDGQRHNLRQSIASVNVEGSTMEVFVFEPAPAEDSVQRPGLVLAQHIPMGHTGIENDEFTLQTAERFARHGYVVAVPFIFHWWPKSAAIEVKRSEARDDWMVADMQAAFELLQARSDVNPGRIGVVGHCWGGRVAWLAACHIPELAACAIFYGGRVKIPMGEGSVAPIELAANIRCPVMGFFGSEDQNPTPADVDDYALALERAGVRHSFHRYQDAGHAFQNFPTPERYHPQASEDAWRKVLSFLAAELGGAP
ncbi:MAG: dienelactone hydrolase family protein [Pseudomonadales bacterium]